MRPRPFRRFETHVLEGSFCDIANALGDAMDKADAVQAQRLRARLSLIDEEMQHRPDESDKFYRHMLRCFIPVGEVRAAAFTIHRDRDDTISVLEPLATTSATGRSPSDLWARAEARRLLAEAGVDLDALDGEAISFWQKEQLLELAGFLEDFLLVRLVEGGDVDEIVLSRDHEVLRDRSDPKADWAAIVAQADRLLAMSPFPRQEVESACDHAFRSDEACRDWLIRMLTRTAERLAVPLASLPPALRGGGAS